MVVSICKVIPCKPFSNVSLSSSFFIINNRDVFIWVKWIILPISSRSFSWLLTWDDKGRLLSIVWFMNFFGSSQPSGKLRLLNFPDKEIILLRWLLLGSSASKIRILSIGKVFNFVSVFDWTRLISFSISASDPSINNLMLPGFTSKITIVSPECWRKISSRIFKFSIESISPVNTISAFWVLFCLSMTVIWRLWRWSICIVFSSWSVTAMQQEAVCDFAIGCSLGRQSSQFNPNASQICL